MGKCLGRGEILFQTLPVCRVTDLFSGIGDQAETIDFGPTRAAGLRRLEQFAARSGRHYASTRNYDLGPEQRSNVSALSPWLRHRLITEEEVLSRVLALRGAKAAEKFIQEVFWRTYFKGWLEQRPSVWKSYQSTLLTWLQKLDGDSDLAATYLDAVSGRTGIDCFDHWARELAHTGYLHNHARMWMASIWIFTLRIPWELGADFFMQHLLDGDPASNTLSWRWVAGLHTKGKTYLARADNITKYTQGRFNPQGLASVAEPLVETVDHPRIALPSPQAAPDSPYLMLLTEDDLSAADVLPPFTVGAIGLLATHGRSPNPVGDIAGSFAKRAMITAVAPLGGDVQTTDDWSAELIGAARRAGVSTIATAYLPVGPARARLDKAAPALRDAGIDLCHVTRPYDQVVWPHAKAGFFGLKKKIPSILHALHLASSPET